MRWQSRGAQALIDFEEVIALEPLKYIGDDFSRVTQVYRVAQYNVGCCYSSIDQVGRRDVPLPECPIVAGVYSIRQNGQQLMQTSRHGGLVGNIL